MLEIYCEKLLSVYASAYEPTSLIKLIVGLLRCIRTN
jgi:hypothetical protein